ncbi:MAG: STAS/SEC14 domain-containing protein [Thermoplasmata archaeon]|nr:STAS/SEC14 domain-containing protein [Thermoplasmata archaeon]
MNMVKGKVNILVDLNQFGKASPESRKIFKEISEYEKTGKVAIFGTHPVARVLASFVMGITKKKDMRFFKTKEEAYAWLKE